MTYRVIKLKEFKDNIAKLKINEKRIDNIITKLKINPYMGRHLTYNYLREKRIDGKRIYFLIYDFLKIVLLVAASDKKSQKKTVYMILDNIEMYKKYAEVLILLLIFLLLGLLMLF